MSTFNTSTTELTVIRTYSCGTSTGVVYAIDGARCATLIRKGLVGKSFDVIAAELRVTVLGWGCAYLHSDRRARVYVAEITGPDAQYVMARKFLAIPSAKSLTVNLGPGLFEVQDYNGQKYYIDGKRISRELAVQMAQAMIPAVAPRISKPAPARQYAIHGARNCYCTSCGCPCSMAGGRCDDCGGF